MSDTGEYVGNTLEWEEVSEKRRMAVEMARLKSSLDNANTNVMVCDRSYEIVYMNKASETTLGTLESEIRKVFPGFSVGSVVGSNIDRFHQDPSKQKRLLDDPNNLPYRVDIKIGPATLDLNVSAIMTEKGEYIGNVVEWSDVSAQKRAQSEVERLISAASGGRLSERIDTSPFSGFLKTLAEGINTMLGAVETPLTEAQRVLGLLAEGDLRTEMAGDYEGSFDEMKQSLNTAIQKLSHTLIAVSEASTVVTNGIQEISNGNEDLSQRTEEQASALEETSSSMEEMTSTVKQNADNAKQANQLVISAREVAEKGGEVTAQTTNAMVTVNKSSKKIVDIISVIDEINKAIIQMDETTQQNAALVEEATSATQSIKGQAEELVHQVEFFKLPGMDADRDASREAQQVRTERPRPAAAQRRPAPTFKPSRPKPTLRQPAYAGVSQKGGNGNARGKRETGDFEEF